ncbi:hypothetical protein WH47_11455 [Habropoda laboriosa]|uniref:Uncharacterized protein n=1 Tax=Habropoda laboriosa TaxID=597456 RepID=A0A0L7QL22_9HYME|nr:hypothetical protein WH47_11455 [Habropoda laboriosa]
MLVGSRNISTLLSKNARSSSILSLLLIYLKVLILESSVCTETGGNTCGQLVEDAWIDDDLPKDLGKV